MYLCASFEGWGDDHVIDVEPYNSLLPLIKEKFSLMERVKRYNEILINPVINTVGGGQVGVGGGSDAIINLSFSDREILPRLPNSFEEKLKFYRRNTNLEELLT